MSLPAAFTSAANTNTLSVSVAQIRPFCPLPSCRYCPRHFSLLFSFIPSPLIIQALRRPQPVRKYRNIVSGVCPILLTILSLLNDFHPTLAPPAPPKTSVGPACTAVASSVVLGHPPLLATIVTKNARTATVSSTLAAFLSATIPLVLLLSSPFVYYIFCSLSRPIGTVAASAGARLWLGAGGKQVIHDHVLRILFASLNHVPYLSLSLYCFNQSFLFVISIYRSRSKKNTVYYIFLQSQPRRPHHAEDDGRHTPAPSELPLPLPLQRSTFAQRMSTPEPPQQIYARPPVPYSWQSYTCYSPQSSSLHL